MTESRHRGPGLLLTTRHHWGSWGGGGVPHHHPSPLEPPPPPEPVGPNFVPGFRPIFSEASVPII